MHAHPSMLLSQKTCKGVERKPQDPEKLFHICVAGLMIDSKGSLFLKQENFFLSDRSLYPVMYGQGSFTVKTMMAKSLCRGQCA